MPCTIQHYREQPLWSLSLLSSYVQGDESAPWSLRTFGFLSKSHLPSLLGVDPNVLMCTTELRKGTSVSIGLCDIRFKLSHLPLKALSFRHLFNNVGMLSPDDSAASLGTIRMSINLGRPILWFPPITMCSRGRVYHMGRHNSYPRFQGLRLRGCL